MSVQGHVSCVMSRCHVSCHVSYVICHMSSVMVLGHVMCHVSCVMCYVMGHMSYVIPM
jgi:hypothetical protein